MSTYSELKKQFDHLQERTLQLFEVGKKREHVLEEIIAVAWNELGRIAQSNDIEAGRKRMHALRIYMADALSDDDPCPVCGNEVRGQGGYLQCECPAGS